MIVAKIYFILSINFIHEILGFVLNAFIFLYYYTAIQKKEDQQSFANCKYCTLLFYPRVTFFYHLALHKYSLLWKYIFIF